MDQAIEPQLIIGLSSGTSMDGIDAALVRLVEASDDVDLVAFRTYPYAVELAEALRAATDATSASNIALLDAAVGEAFASAATDLLAAAGVSSGAVRGIGSHGQTLVHLPDLQTFAGRQVRATLQIGNAAVIAERTGITTVSDFRSRDVAAGGQGAPLVPLLDHRLYRDPDRGRAVLNIGGIANLTALPPAARLEEVQAFDTGPGNVLLDSAARLRGLSAGYDVDGRLGLAGAADAAVLELALAHPFFQAAPPKSADSGDFLGHFAASLWDASASLNDAALFATLAALTARTVGDAIDAFIRPLQPVDEVVISGGGAHNRAVVEALASRLGETPLRTSEEVAGLPGDAKEAVAFALLAFETLGGRSGNVPAGTGADGPRLLGAITPAG